MLCQLLAADHWFTKAERSSDERMASAQSRGPKAELAFPERIDLLNEGQQFVAAFRGF